MKNIFFGIHLLAATILPLAAFTPIEFKADTPPEQQQFTKIGAVVAPTSQVEGHTVLDINDTSTTDGAAFSHKITDSDTQVADGFVFEIAGRIEPTTGPSSQGATLSLHNLRLILNFHNEKGAQDVSIYDIGQKKHISSSSKDTLFHVWKLVKKTGVAGTVDFYCDDKLVASGIQVATIGSNDLTFGALGKPYPERFGHVLYERVTMRPLSDQEAVK